MKDITYLNRSFRFVLEPKQGAGQFSLNLFKKRSDKRFLLGAGQLSNYITQKNA